VRQVLLGPGRIRVELGLAGQEGSSFTLSFELQSGWLVASVADAGALRHLTRAQLATLRDALAGLYKLAGVDLSREQITELLLGRFHSYEITQRGLVAHGGDDSVPATVYDLHLATPTATHRGVARHPRFPHVLDGKRLVYSRAPLPWQRWEDVWQDDLAGRGHYPPLLDSFRLLTGESLWTG
jgi:hypothetical protein